ncbi:hypothetical protein [Halobacterium litoreum]|uniref:Membrane protein YqaA, SNARE-associated domain n=1 Tax=Halobacterium litoreum TaxID=2039234 RepID=A0ABD5NGE2_9EURY|nr:hypothetical protein [Halobacterium litoreum]UHH12914.1 hypothetical protein LT972_12190 [Halobacterium litoreum]
MLGAIETLVATTTGPLGLLLVFAFSFLVAFVLPLPGELVLIPAAKMVPGVPPVASIAVVVAVSAVGKAIGSVVAYRVGRGTVESLSTWWLLGRFSFGSSAAPIEGRVTSFVRRYGYVGLAVTLSIPLMPDTAVIYAFSLLETDDERMLALAAFVGTVGRLVVSLALVTGALRLV